MPVKKLFPLLLLCLFVSVAKAQNHFAVKSYSAGYRISQIESVANNPTDLFPLLKNPDAYSRFITSFPYNGYGGSPGPATMHSYYLNAELYKPQAAGFWKHTLLRAGLFVTNNMSKQNGYLENRQYIDPVVYLNTYSLRRNLRFAGIHAGISKALPVGKRWQLTAGIEVQGGIAITHNYEPRMDSIVQSFNPDSYFISTTHLPSLQGKNYFQWQFAIPLGVQYEVWKHKWQVRVEAVPALAGNRFLTRSFAAREAHAAGVWLIYLL